MKNRYMLAAVSAGAIATLAFTAPGLSFPTSKGSAPASPAAKEVTQVDPKAPVAVVNGNPITKREYDLAMRAQMQRLQQMQGGMHGGVNEPNEQIKSAVLDRLVDEELLYEESLKFPMENVEQKVNEVFEQNKAQAPNAEAFSKALEAQGLTEETAKALLGRRISVWNYVQTQIRPGVTVSEDEVEKFYEGNSERFTVKEQMTKASHILIKVPEGAKPEEKEVARKKAEALKERAVAGEDFAELARENSEGPSAPRGGDLGFFTRNRMVGPFADAAFSLDVGAVSEIVETQYGYHVIKATDRLDAGPQSLEQVKDEATAQLTEMAVNNAVQAKIQELRSVAKIEVVTPHL